MSVWDSRIEKAEKYLSEALEHGKKVYTRYQDKRDSQNLGDSNAKKVNLFYANVNTLKESLFNSLPKPDVSRLHKGDFEDDPARVAALMLQRALHYEVQCAPHFQSAVEHAILDRLVPGIGQVWLRFEMDKDEAGNVQPGTERIFIDTVYWEDFIYAPTRTWEQMPWVGRRLELTKAEVKSRWGEEALQTMDSVSNRSTTDITPKEVTQGKYCIYEIWSKKDKKVYFISKGAEKPLEVKDDPLGLDNFFPCPCPLIANPTTTSFLPVTDYHIAQDQYIQLDVLYARMALITTAIKVAGVYDSGSPEIGRMLQGGENMLIPVDNWAMFAERGGAKGMVDWYPVEQCVGVLQALAQQFEAIKAMLYEVTGMSDIMRGASNQYETAAAQEIKSQFASVRMNGYQRDVAEFVSQIMNLMAQMMCNLYSDQKMMQVVGPLSEADRQFLPQAAQILRSSAMRMYKVSVDADSLVQADWALEKGQRMELMGYLSQFLQSAVPAIESNPQLATLLMSMMKFTIVGYRGSAEIEGIIDQQIMQIAAAQKAQEGQPDEPTPEEQKMQAEMAKMQAEFQLEQQKMRDEMMIKQQESQNKMELELTQARADMATERERMALQAQAERQRMAAEALANQQKLEFMLKEHMLKMQTKREEANLKLEVTAAQAAMKQESQNGKDKDD